MVRWNIEKTALWKNKDVEKEAFELVTKQDNLGLSLLFAIGVWAVWQQVRKEKAVKKEVFGAVTMTPELVKECFDDKVDGANSFVIGGLDEEREALLRRGMDMLVFLVSNKKYVGYTIVGVVIDDGSNEPITVTVNDGAAYS